MYHQYSGTVFLRRPGYGIPFLVGIVESVSQSEAGLCSVSTHILENMMIEVCTNRVLVVARLEVQLLVVLY